MAPKSIPAGSDYSSEIPKAIDKDKTIIPLKIDHSMINDRFKFFLLNCQMIGPFNTLDDVEQELVKTLIELVGQRTEISFVDIIKQMPYEKLVDMFVEKTVSHTQYGVGIILEVANYVLVKFNDGQEKKFVFPEVFLKGYLTLEDEDTETDIMDKIMQAYDQVQYKNGIG